MKYQRRTHTILDKALPLKNKEKNRTEHTQLFSPNLLMKERETQSYNNQDSFTGREHQEWVRSVPH